jgi:hypothetical protein
MRKRCLLVPGLLAMMTACSSNTPLAGTEKGACYRNNTCNAGLVCLSELCVRIPEAGLPFDAQARRDSPLPPPGERGMMPPWGERGMMPPGERGIRPPGERGIRPREGGTTSPPDAGFDLSSDGGPDGG